MRRILGRARREYERYGYLYIQANVIVFLLCIPIVTAPAAYAGLIRMTTVAQRQTFTSFAEFWIGFREHFVRSLILGGINAAILVMLYVNYTTFERAGGPLFIALRAAWGVILIVWLGLQLYVWPLLEHMEPLTIIGAYRNAAIMFIKNPALTFGLILFVVLWLVFCSLLVVPLAAFFFGLTANVTVAAVRDRLGVATILGDGVE